MSKQQVEIRLMKADDFEAVVAIDDKVVGGRREYYDLKFEKLFNSNDFLPTSLVAEIDGQVVGFVMGALYIGEYGIAHEGASLDTIGVDPDCRNIGVGKKLIEEFVDHVKRIGVTKINTLVGWDDSKLMHFFSMNKFSPSKTVNLERAI